MTSSFDSIADMTLENLADALGYKIFAVSGEDGTELYGLTKDGVTVLNPVPINQLWRRLMRALRRSVDRRSLKKHSR